MGAIVSGIKGEPVTFPSNPECPAMPRILHENIPLYLCHPPDPANVHTPNPSPHSRSPPPPPFSSSLRYLRKTTRLDVYLPALELRNDAGVFSVDASSWVLLREDMETVIWMSAGCASRGNFEALEDGGV